MSVSDDRPELDDNDVESALDEVLEAINQVPPLLSGDPVDVTLTIKVANATSPQEAVDQFMETLGRNGSKAMFFFIEDDENGERYAIRNGRVYDPDGLTDHEDNLGDDDADEPQ